MTVAARPGYHFTVPKGWINDPHGVSWHDGRYELFFQYNPAAPEWVVACRWGRASAPGLVRWGRPEVALSPQDGEAGCWTGSVVTTDDGIPVIVYTSVRPENLDLGTVVLATGDRDWRDWTAEPSAPVLTGPPEGLGLRIFRDPHVERDGAGWRMVVGGGTDDGRGLALLYRSADLRSWTFEGILAERPADLVEPVAAGAAWECVQFFPLDGRWVLLLSAWEDGVPARVVAAVGDFDGSRFTATGWQRFGATDVLYATTTFLDADGRRCAMSWARDLRPVSSGYAGALSLPWRLAVHGDRLVQFPHPDVDTLRTGRLALLQGPGRAGPFLPFLDVELVPGASPGPVRLELRGNAGPAVLTVVLDGDGAAVLQSDDGEPVELDAASAPDGDTGLRLLIDSGLVEVATATGDAAFLRVPDPGALNLAVLEGPSSAVIVHGMPSGRS